MSPGSKTIVEKIIGPCLEAAGAEVIYGGQLDKNESTAGSPGSQAKNLIDTADRLLAIVVRDENHIRPSNYVMHEVGYAQGKEKSPLLFVDNEINELPSAWTDQYTPKRFDRADSGSLAVEVLRSIRKRSRSSRSRA